MIIKGHGSHVFGPGISLNVWKNRKLIVGDNFSVATHLRLFTTHYIEIGQNNMWSFYNLVLDTDARPIFDKDWNLINPPRKIIFGNDCWIGTYCKILKESEISDGCIIGGGSVVTRRLPQANGIYLGNKLIRENVSWKRNIL